MPILNQGGNYLKTADAKNGDMITFRNEGEWIENNRYKYPDGNPKVDFVMKISHKGEEKLFRVNQTNRNTLIEAYGRDTSRWVGKSAIIVLMTALVGGKKMDVITLEVNQEDKIKPEDQGEATEPVDNTDDVPF